MIEYSESELEALWQNAKKMNEYFSKRQGASIEKALTEYTHHLTKLNNRINKFLKEYFITDPIYNAYTKPLDVSQKDKLKKRRNRMENDMSEIIRIHQVIESLNYSEIIKADNKNIKVKEEYSTFQKMYNNFDVFRNNLKKIISKLNNMQMENRMKRNKTISNKQNEPNDEITIIRQNINKTLVDIQEASSSFSYMIKGLTAMQDKVIKDVIDDLTVILGDYLFKPKKPI